MLIFCSQVTLEAGKGYAKDQGALFMECSAKDDTNITELFNTIGKRQTDRQTDRERDRQTDRQTERERDRQTDRQTDRQRERDRQTDRQTD